MGNPSLGDQSGERDIQVIDGVDGGEGDDGNDGFCGDLILWIIPMCNNLFRLFLIVSTFTLSKYDKSPLQREISDEKKKR